MLQEIVDSMNKKTPLSEKAASGKTIFRCPRADCRGYACYPDMSCTLCQLPIDREADGSSSVISREFNGSPPKKQPRFSGRQIATPILILSVGKSGIFDARNGPCIITTASLSCKVKVEGSWVAVSIKPVDVQSLVFCEELQVVFLKPRDHLKESLASSLKLSNSNNYNASMMKWIILVLGDRMAHSPEKNVLVQQMELIGSSIRANDGFCKMNCTWMETRNLLLDCGLRLPRAESRAQAMDSTNAQSPVVPSTQVEQPTTSKSNNESHLTSNNSHPKSDGGLLNSVISTLSSAGMHILGNAGNSAALSSKQLSGPKSVGSSDQENKESEDLIILCEEESESADDDGTKSGSRSPNATTGSEDVADSGAHSHFKFDYQPPGSTDSVILTSTDLDCLTPGALINDAIINFYLKYLYFEQLSDLQRACAYVFNCFFYSRLAGVAQTTPSASTRSQLTKPNSDSVSSLAPASLARHANVAKWTRRVDLFCKDYIIIPINEASHWFLGLVCYPWMAGMVSYTALYQAEAFDMCQLTERFANVDSLIGQLNVDDQTMCNAPLERLPSDMVGSAFDRWRRQRLVWLRSRGINAMPCILLFDSLPCQTRVSNLHVIRDYLQAEWDTRRAEQDGPLSFNKDTIRGFSPRVPSQSNLVDCGIYLLHYVEMFFKQPVKSYTKGYFQHEMASWFSEATVGEKRMEIYNVIMRLHERSRATDQTA